MSGERRRVSVGLIGSAHGKDGSFYVERPDHPFDVGAELEVAGASHRVERRAGTDRRPLVRISGVESPEAAKRLRGEHLVTEEALEEGEWLAGDLVGCSVEGMGEVQRVIAGPSCDVLELEDGTLVPLVEDAVIEVDAGGRRIRVDRGFLGLE